MDQREKLKKVLLKVRNPSRYTGGELGSVVKDRSEVRVRFAFCFPDTYDIGMSHIGMKILYSLKNRHEGWQCERVFAPSPDFEELMRSEGILLYGLETLEPINTADLVGFTLQYELCYTNVLNMLDLAGIPVRSADRGENDPIICAGGPCVCDPEPLADFIDMFFIGEGEELNIEVMELYDRMKAEGRKRSEFIREAARIEGVYVPSLYDVSYNDDGTIKAVAPKYEDVPAKVRKRVIYDLDSVFYPEEFVVPFSEIVHDRAVVEVIRGCLRGCRFCQAGFIYRPYREKSTQTVRSEAKSLCESTGYEELSLASLSTADHSRINELLKEVTEYTEENHVSLALPSMRIDAFSEELSEALAKIRRSGLTFAPEAGTQRLRDVINKNITEEEILNGCKIAFMGGYCSVKLYFMLGLPTETDEDIKGIADLAMKIADIYFRNKERPKGARLSISISCATFVPKPFTPFQFEPQITYEEIRHRQGLLLDLTRGKRYISVSYHNYRVSLLEAVLAKGDRRVGRAIEEAWRNGAKLDGWDEYFKFDTWMEAFEKTGINVDHYAHRKAPYEEIMPWEHLDYMVDKSFFIRENKAAHSEKTTPDCRTRCSGCGMKDCPVHSTPHSKGMPENG